MTKKELQSINAGMVKLLKYLMANSDKCGGIRTRDMERQYQQARRLVARAEKS